MKSWKTLQMWQLTTLIAFCPREAVKTGKDNKHIHKVPRRCDITSSSLMSHFSNQVWKWQLKFEECEKKQSSSFQATTHPKGDGSWGVWLSKTANAHAPSQTNKHEMGLPALSNNQHSHTASSATDSTVNHSHVVCWSFPYFSYFNILSGPKLKYCLLGEILKERLKKLQTHEHIVSVHTSGFLC